MGFFERSKKAKKSSSSDASTRASSRPATSRHQHRGAPMPSLPSPPQPQQQQLQSWWHDPNPYPQPMPFQPAGYLPAPPGWTPQPPPQQPQQPPPPYAVYRPYQPVIVNQHYYLAPPSSAAPEQKPVAKPCPGSGAMGSLSKLGLGSVVHLTKELVPHSMGSIPQLYDDSLSAWHGATRVFTQTVSACDQIAICFNDVMTQIDREHCSGHENALFSYQPSVPAAASNNTNGGAPPVQGTEVVVVREHDMTKKKKRKEKEHTTKGQAAVASTMVGAGTFAKVELYANSRLPMDLPRLKLYVPTWPLLCMAAQYAERVYESPRGAERDAHVDADWRTGSKAMVIKSVPMDDRNTIVFAVRGTATFLDWTVNLNNVPVPPTGFLDDPGNLCHAGFLSVAKRMVKPVAARLRQLLEEDPGRSAYSLLITGHSAGGAVAALLYSHMLANTKAARSELNVLTGCFKRIHCITFGAPPLSLLPLTRPDRPELRKSLFLSFLNEGDPVVRADKAYIRSLIDLYATAAPDVRKESKDDHGSSKTKSKSSLATKASKATLKTSRSGSSSSSRPTWKVPPCTLSNAGRLVVLRSGDPKARLKDRKTVEERLVEGVVAQTLTEDQLRGVIWGDPVAHLMKLYSGRIETLAVGAVTARTYA